MQGQNQMKFFDILCKNVGSVRMRLEICRTWYTDGKNNSFHAECWNV